MMAVMVVKYVAYIDESGDPGLGSVKPIDPNGSSEWLIVSCFLVRQEKDHRILNWVKEIKSQFKVSNTPILHFSDLNEVKKKIACETLVKKQSVMFAIMSHKANMKGYENPNIRDGSKHYFYWFLCRLLLERVTEFCERITPIEEKGAAKLKIVFSKRGGHIYKEMIDYLWKLKRQSDAGLLYLKADLAWSVIDFDEIFVFEHSRFAGLQAADVVAGSFFDAVEYKSKRGLCSDYAKILKPRMAKDKFERNLGFGIFTRPDLADMGLTTEQKTIFEHYGYNKNGW